MPQIFHRSTNTIARVTIPGAVGSRRLSQTLSIVLTRPSPLAWMLGIGVSFLLVLMLMLSIAYLLAVGVGIWGIQIPVAWGFTIVNFVS
jgi:molybdopterin-containing oxidoreductase family membrane subunit